MARSGATLWLGLGRCSNSFRAAFPQDCFHDGSALAAGIAGELASYEAAFPILQTTLGSFLAKLDAGSREGIALRHIDRPHDLFYEASVSKVGLLGVDLVEDVVYVYSRVGGMRVGLSILREKSDEMQDAEMHT